MDIDDGKYDELLIYIESGSKGNLSEEMIAYLNLLELIRSMHMRYQNRQAIVRFLQNPPYELSPYLAGQRFAEAVNFFYLDHEIKKDAWRNMYAEKLDRAADLVLKTAVSSKDIDVYKNLIYAAKDLRGLDEKDKLNIPDDFFKKPTKIYTLDPKQLGRNRPDRRLLAKHIDSLNIPEADKQRARSDAMIDDIEFLPIDESED